jgi:molecular chaperone GrpE
MTETQGIPDPEPTAEAAAAAGTQAAEAPADNPLATEVADLKDRLLRALAEIENVRRRGEKEREDARLYAATGFARDMCRVADNLRRALSSVPAEAKDGNAALATLLEGVELTERDLLSIFERNGIKRIEPMGQKFDHNLHEALFEVPGTGQPGGTVIQVVEPGYTIHDRLLRPARVGVAQADAGPQRVDTSA